MQVLRARDVMTAPVITVRPEASLVEVARTLVGARISGAPVVDEDGTLLGMVTEADLLPKEAGPVRLPPVWGLLEGLTREVQEQVRRYRGRTAAEVMTRRVITAEEGTPVRQLAALMIRHRINRIPIVREGKVVGIVSRNDILRALARTDAELAALVRETILRDLWIDADALDIQVRDGVVTIRGRVDRRGDISLIESYVRRIDGVVDVDVRGLTYALDERALAP